MISAKWNMQYALYAASQIPRKVRRCSRSMVCNLGVECASLPCCNSHHHIFVYYRSCDTQHSRTYYDNSTLLCQHTDINLTVTFIGLQLIPFVHLFAPDIRMSFTFPRLSESNNMEHYPSEHRVFLIEVCHADRLFYALFEIRHQRCHFSRNR